jgi:hypothetical protein
VCVDDKYTKDTVVYRGKDCVKVFLDKLRDEVKHIHSIKGDVKDIIMSAQDNINYTKATNCHICNKPLIKDDGKVDKVRDHCHISGHFRGPSHNQCNRDFKFKQTIPVIFHNLRGYDSHIIMQHIGSYEEKITCIANNMEKYISFSLGILRFIDSLQFLNCSLEKLVDNLNTNDFKHTKSEIKDWQLITRKGVYPYDYMDEFGKFEDTELPPIESFYSVLNKKDISDDDYLQAQSVWDAFNITDMGEYHDLYLKSDVLLLADVFENFRNTCTKYYNLDPAHYYTSPGLAWDAALKMTDVKLELLTDIDMHLMIEKGIRGGISTITNRYSKANNKYMGDDYDYTKPSKYIIYLDANNLYGWAMCKPLPVKDFKWLNETEINDLDIMLHSDNNKKGYILEVDLEYPEYLHSTHADYPLAPESLEVTKDMLSEYSKNLQNKFQLSTAATHKLIPNLYNKTKYVIHYRNLKLYLSLGLKLTKIHRVIEFTQEAWLKKYIMFNTDRRKEANNTFEKDFFKLMNNSVFGKTMENLRKHLDIHLVCDPEQTRKLINKPNFNYQKIFTEELIGINMKKTNLFLKNPMYCGFTILDNSKMLMYDFHYNYIQKKYKDNNKLLFTDTDSLCYEIHTEDIYKDMYEDRTLFDLSNLPKDSKYYDESNKKVIGKFKSEEKMDPIMGFVGSRSKMYSIKTKKDETKKAKGIKKGVVKNNLTYNDFKNSLFDGTKTLISMNTIRSFNHQLMSCEQNKIGLSAYDDKRYILDNGYNTLPYGSVFI